MGFADFALRLVLAVAFGTVIGLERQWRQRLAGLRTTALVSTGAALFVMTAGLSAGDDSPTRIAAQVVSGIGFLGAGVIIRDGLNIRGLNTAATLWCAAGVGVLVGSGFPAEAALGTVAVLFSNLLLRSIAQRLVRHSGEGKEVPVRYRIRAICQSTQESHIRALLLHGVNALPFGLQALHSADLEDPAHTEVLAILVSQGRHDGQIEQVVARLSLEPAVSSVRWEASALDDERADGAEGVAPTGRSTLMGVDA